MVIIGERYEENRKKLIREVRDGTINFVVIPASSINARCYFCHGSIREGNVVILCPRDVIDGRDTLGNYFVHELEYIEMSKGLMR